MSASGASTKPRSAMPGCGTTSCLGLDALVAEHQQVQVQRARTPAFGAHAALRATSMRAQRGQQRPGGQLRQQSGNRIDEIALLHRAEGSRAIQARARNQPRVGQAQPAHRTQPRTWRRGIAQVAADAYVGRHPGCHSGPAGRRRRRRRRGRSTARPRRSPPSLPPVGRARPPAPRPCPARCCGDAACSAVHQSATSRGAMPTWARSSSRS